jgi:predicted secreted protein
MATDASIGHGTLWKRGNGATPTEVFATVAEVTALSGPGMSKDTVDATHMESPDRYREFISGLRDGGEVTVTLNLLAKGTAFTGALADFNSNAGVNYEMLFTDGSKFALKGILTGFNPDMPLDDKMTLELTYKVTGKPTFTAGT